jgi:hypothetical protein
MLDSKPRRGVAGLCSALSRRCPWLSHVVVVATYVAVAVLYSWPLAANLGTALTGPPTGDTGVYVWNLWVFQHELFTNGGSPLLTSSIFSLGPQVDLSLHNYTVFADLLGVPLIPAVGVVAAFNLIYLALMTVTAYGMYLLVRDVVGSRLEAWVGGLFLAFSPALIARGTAHFSLVAAAPLPLFALCLRRVERSRRASDMAWLGAVLAWATYCDPYYGVYCLVIGAWHMGTMALTIGVEQPQVPSSSWVKRALDVILAGAGTLALFIVATGGGTWKVAGVSVGLRSLHTPMLIMTVAGLARAAWWLRPVVRWRPSPRFFRLWSLAPYGAVSSVFLLSPLLWTMAIRVFEGRYVSPKVLWRSSTPGVDLLAFIAPNPNHPLVHPFVSGWLARQDGGFAENVASLPLVAMIVIAVATVKLGVRLQRYWLGLGLVTALLALGPFVRVGGFNLCVPTPWTLGRYIPVLSEARAPARFTVLVMLAAGVLFAVALRAITSRYPAARTRIVAVVTALLLLELLPSPRPLYSAVAPSVYDIIAASPVDTRVLELPFGARDGLASYGNFNASAQFYQTRHERRLFGGYLSRVAPQRVETLRRFPVLNALMLLSQGQPVSPELESLARARADRFVKQTHLGFVVVAHHRAPDALVNFAIEVLDLERIAETETRTLYRPRQAEPGALAAASTGATYQP